MKRFSLQSLAFSLVTCALLISAQRCDFDFQRFLSLPSRPPSRGDLLQPSLWEDPKPRPGDDDAFLTAPEILTSRNEVLRKGAYGPRIATVQEFLKRAGLYTGEISGYYDERTEAAVKKFQAAFGLKPDGRIGWKTAEAMRQVMRGEVR
ncbi:MAG: peptidoglycan-binding domain-containing protein [bacterium JZ-2024 1]